MVACSVGLVEVVGVRLEGVKGAGATVAEVVGVVLVCTMTGGGAWSVVTGVADVVVTLAVGEVDTGLKTLGGVAGVVVGDGCADVGAGAGIVVLSTAGLAGGSF